MVASLCSGRGHAHDDAEQAPVGYPRQLSWTSSSCLCLTIPLDAVGAVARAQSTCSRPASRPCSTTNHQRRGLAPSMRTSGRTGICALAACLSGCATQVAVSTPGSSSTTVLEVRQGMASYFGPEFHGRTMASGGRFDMNAMGAAHPSYPFGTLVRVTNLRNGRSVRVRIVDRGPAPRLRADGVIIDLSRGAAQRLGYIRQGRAPVRVEVLKRGVP